MSTSPSTQNQSSDSVITSENKGKQVSESEEKNPVNKETANTNGNRETNDITDTTVEVKVTDVLKQKTEKNLKSNSNEHPAEPIITVPHVVESKEINKDVDTENAASNNEEGSQDLKLNLSDSDEHSTSNELNISNGVSAKSETYESVPSSPTEQSVDNAQTSENMQSSENTQSTTGDTKSPESEQPIEGTENRAKNDSKLYQNVRVNLGINLEAVQQPQSSVTSSESTESESSTSSSPQPKDETGSESEFKFTPFRYCKRLLDNSSLIANYSGNSTRNIDFSIKNDSIVNGDDSKNNSPSFAYLTKDLSYSRTLRSISGRRTVRNGVDESSKCSSAQKLKTSKIIQPVIGQKRTLSSDSLQDTELYLSTGGKRKMFMTTSMENAKRMKSDNDGGFFSYISTPINVLRRKFSRSQIASSTPNKTTYSVTGSSPKNPLLHELVDTGNISEDKLIPESTNDKFCSVM